MARTFLRFLLATTLLAATALAETPGTAERLSQLRSLRDNLELFLSGAKPVYVPPASLFSVDLSDEDAVRRRIAVLRDAAASAAGPPSGEGAPKGAEEEIRRLEREVSALRLRFLSLPLEKRTGILAAHGSARAHGEKAERLARERSSAEEERGDAARSAEAAEEQARTARSAAVRELAARRGVLEKTREELAALQVLWTGALEERNRFYRETAYEISALAARTAGEAEAEQSRENLKRIDAIWRRLVDRIFSQLASPEFAAPLPEIPGEETPRAATGTAEERLEEQAHREVRRKVEELQRSLARLREERYREERDNLYLLLLRSGELRSRLMQEYLDKGGKIWTRNPREALGDLFREIRIVPYRLIALSYSRIVDFRGKAGEGIGGYVDILRHLLYLLAILLVPYVAYRLLNRLRLAIDRLRGNLLSTRFRHPAAGKLALFLRGASPYVPWVFLLLAVQVADGLVAGTALAEIGQLLPYATFYLCYRVFRILGTSLFVSLSLAGGREGPAIDRERIRRSVRGIGLFFLFLVSALHATEMVAGKALAYGVVRRLLLYAGTLVLFCVARRWRLEIGAMAAALFPGAAGERIRRLCSGNVSSWFCSFPALLLELLVRFARWITGWAFRFDLFKRAGAELFRRRLEGTAERKGKGAAGGEAAPEGLPAEYLRWFELHGPPPEQALVRPEKWVAPRLRSMIEEWADGRTEEHSVMLYGDKGSGKTTLLRSFAATLPVDRTVYAPLPARLRKREDVLRYFGERLGVDLAEGPAALSRAFTGAAKTAVLVDDAQNLFLSALGGFEGYGALGDLVTAPTDSLFWVVAINRRSWEYLDGVFGKNHCFRRVFEAPAWPDSDIRELILSRHGLSGLRVSYDSIIRAVQSAGEDAAVAQLEEQFFRLLWGQSRGNPRAAMVLWLSALSPAPDGSLRVGIPRFQAFQPLERAGDDTLFVFAAIVRHENLAIGEIVEAANLPERVVRHALRFGVDCGAVARFPDGRYRPTPEAQFALNQLLERRNFLHG